VSTKLTFVNALVNVGYAEALNSYRVAAAVQVYFSTEGCCFLKMPDGLCV